MPATDVMTPISAPSRTSGSPALLPSGTSIAGVDVGALDTREAVRTLERRAGPPYAPVTLAQLQAGTESLLRTQLTDAFTVRDCRWLSGGASKLQMAFTLDWHQPGVGAATTPLVLRCGTEDELIGSNRALVAALQPRGWALDYRESPGGHSFQLWSHQTEAMLLALSGGVLGGLIAYGLFNNMSVSTLGSNFTQVAFNFAVTPALMEKGLSWALVIGLLGGLPPALKAARQPVVEALRAR